MGEEENEYAVYKDERTGTDTGSEWGRSMNKDKDTNVMQVEWKFVDENDEAHVILINEVEMFASNKSKKEKWKFDLYDWKIIKNGNKKQVSVTIAIKYDANKKKYAY